MPNFRSVYRRYSMACATATIAIFIGFVMERTEASHAPVTPNSSVPTKPPLSDPFSSLEGLRSAPVERAASVVLPPIPRDRNARVVLPGTPMVIASADEVSRETLTDGRPQAQEVCKVALQALPVAGAMVQLSLDASCRGGERVSIHHSNMQFTEVLDAAGQLSLTIPALETQAEFAVEFVNGYRTSTSLVVESLAFYDRTVIRWTGESGVELHAREFGASYGDEGHVWRGQSRDMTALVGGSGGFLTTLGDANLSAASFAEIYTFPSMTASKSGRINLSVEAEITDANCGREITVVADMIKSGEMHSSREMQMEIPACDAVGQFLVLKNLVEDLTIAQK